MSAPAPCPRCGAALPEGTRFCTNCGAPTAAGETVPAPAGTPPEPAPLDTPPEVEARLVACPSCDASNAASRRFCGRCGAALRPGEDAPEPLLPLPDAPAPGESRRRDGGMPAVLAVVIVLLSLAIVGVVLTILSARGVWLFAGPEEPPGPPAPVEVAVASVRASSEVPPAGEVHYGPENLLDGDETTAWKEGVAGDGAGEWVEIQLARPTAVSRLLVWNGYQSRERFREHNRVARARVQVGDRAFTADLLDVRGPQAIDLPEAVTADRVRLEIVEVHAGGRYEDTALSGLEVYAQPPGGDA